MMMATDADLLARFTELAELSEQDIADAEAGWRGTLEALERGIECRKQTSRRQQIHSNHDRYTGLARYCDDARDLIAHYAANDTGDHFDQVPHTIFAIDPHLMTAYAEYWRDIHKGFYFLHREKNAGEEESYGFSTTKDMLSVYEAVQKDFKVALLDSGRAELSELVAYMSETDARSESVPDEKKALLETLKELLEKSRSPEIDDPSEYLADSFNRLVELRGTPALRQNVASARVRGILSRGNFFNPEGCLRQTIGQAANEATKAKLEQFSKLQRELRSNPGLLNASRNKFSKAYDIYREIYDIGQSNRKDAPAYKRWRPGELHDVNAIFEVHVLNASLEIVGLPHSFRYVTLSPRMYDFVRQFDRGAMYARLIHPRTAVVYAQNELAREHAAALALALGNAVAFGSEIPKDLSIRESELDRFEEMLGKLIASTRHALSYSMPARSEGRDNIIMSLDGYFGWTPEEVDEVGYADVREEINGALSRTVTEVGESFDVQAHTLTQPLIETYADFLKDIGSDQAYVALRRVEFKDGTARFTVIPITGGFRHLFVLHNKSLANWDWDLDVSPERLAAFKAGKSIAVGMNTLLGNVADAAKKSFRDSDSDSLVSRKAKATEYFLRACFAASNREWTLVLALTTQATEALLARSETYSETDIPESCNPAIDGLDPAEVEDRAKAAQINREILFLRHLAKRAIAKVADVPRRRATWLRKSADDLRMSAQYTVEFSGPITEFETPFSPISIRQAMAATALQIEYFAVHAERQNEPVVPIAPLPKTTRTGIAWHDIEILNSNELLLDRREFLKELGSASVVIEARAHECFESVENFPDIYNKDYWRFIYLRAASLKLVISALRFVFRDIEWEIDISKQVLDTVRSLLRDHRSFVEKILKDAEAESSHRTSDNPFTEGLLAVHDLIGSVQFLSRPEGPTARITDLGDALAAFAQIEKVCNRLQRYGFPREVLRASKRQFAGPICEYLQTEYELKG